MELILDIGWLSQNAFRLPVSSAAKLVYLSLVSHCEHDRLMCWPSIRRLALYCSIHRNTVTTSILELESIRAIHVTRHIKATHKYHLMPLNTVKLAEFEAQEPKKSVPNEGTDLVESGLPVVHNTLHPLHLSPLSPHFVNVTTQRYNDGKMYEEAFWMRLGAIGFCGQAAHGPSKIPVSVKKCRSARHWLATAWVDHKWWIPAIETIERAYALPYSPYDWRKTSIKALLDDFLGQHDKAKAVLATASQPIHALPSEIQ